jgi:hypothetical protein
MALGCQSSFAVPGAGAMNLSLLETLTHLIVIKEEGGQSEEIMFSRDQVSDLGMS